MPNLTLDNIVFEKKLNNVKINIKNIEKGKLKFQKCFRYIFLWMRNIKGQGT